MSIEMAKLERAGFIQSLVDQFHGVSDDSFENWKDRFDPVFTGIPPEEQRELAHEFQVLMMQWNYDHQGSESINPYASLFHYLDALG